jgi:hypothetical protein
MTHPDYTPRLSHSCFFCHPERYPEMPEGKTLCARCGDMIDRVEGNTLRNDAMDLCARCEIELEVGHGKA